MNTHRHSNRRSLLERAVACVAIAVLVVLAAGCASVNRLREAQDAFNQAAAAENALRFDAVASPEGGASDTAALWSVARNGYASALLSLEKLDGDDQRRLREDGLWGTTLTLKALSQWRLGLFSKALATAEEAKTQASDQMYPRDRAVLAALPGLIKTDQAYDQVLHNTPVSEVEELLIGGNGAVANIQSARAMADKSHPVQIYLIQAQLAAYRNFMVAQDRLNNHATVPTEHRARKAADAQLKELDGLLKAQGAGPAGQDLVNYWARLCGLEVP